MDDVMTRSKVAPLSRPPYEGIARRYGFAILAVALTFALRWQLNPYLGFQAPLLAFVGAVLLAAWHGGLGPGLAATALSLLVGSYYFLPPVGEIPLESASLIHMALFGVIGTTISVLNHHLQTARSEE